MAASARKPYFSPMRQRQAEHTRRTILDSAQELLITKGYVATTVEAIAAASGVAPQTVMAIFGNKPGILAEVVKRWEFGQWELVEESMAADQPAAYIRWVARYARSIYESGRAVLELMYGATVIAAELADLKAEFDQARKARLAWVITQLAGRDALSCNRNDALDLIWGLTGLELYRALVMGCGWPPAKYEAQLAQLLGAALLRPN